MFSWLGIAIIPPSNLFLQLETIIGEGRNLKKEGLLVNLALRYFGSLES